MDAFLMGTLSIVSAPASTLRYLEVALRESAAIRPFPRRLSSGAYSPHSYGSRN